MTTSTESLTFYEQAKRLTLTEVENELARRNAVNFAKACGLSPDPWQEDVLTWQGDRLILNCHRQAGKSTIASVIALYYMTTIPKFLTLIVSPAERQSKELFNKVRESMREMPDELRPKLIEDNKLSCTTENGSRIVALPGEEKTIRGFSGAGLIIEDEAARVGDPLFMSILPMLAVSKGKLILMSTPFGKAGHFHDIWHDTDPQWKRVEVPATLNPRITPDFLEEARRRMGDWWFDQEYMCKFREDIDSVFSYDLIQKAMDESIKPLFGVGQ